MATVYHAWDPSFSRDVALKVLPPQFTHDDQFRARFEREARTIARLEHSAIVPVYDFGEQGNQPFLVMRLMSGGSLVDRLMRGRLPVREVATLYRRLGRALDKAHSQGIVHRDLKPGNILFDDDDDAYISDFGIAKLKESAGATLTQGVIGTPSYMSPEQARGIKDVDGRSDVYALGVMLFELLTGALPYQGDTPMGIAMMHLIEPIPDILTLRSDLPADAKVVILKAMAKDRDQRYSRASELAAAVDALARQVADRPAVVQPATLIETPVDFETPTPTQKAQAEAEQRQATEDAEPQAKLEAERQSRLEAERQAKAEAERMATAEAERQAKLEAERQAKLEAERQAKLEAERQAKLEAERQAKLEAERQAKLEAERQAKLEAERQAKLEAKQQAKLEAERQAKADAERKAKEEAERQAKLEAERQAKLEAERQAKAEDERQVKEEAEHRASAKMAARDAASVMQPVHIPATPRRMPGWTRVVGIAVVLFIVLAGGTTAVLTLGPRLLNNAAAPATSASIEANTETADEFVGTATATTTSTPTAILNYEAALDTAEGFTGGNADWEPVPWTFEDDPTGATMLLVPPGCFVMGSDRYDREGPVHEQCFEQPFWIDETEVTRAHWQACVDAGVCRVREPNQYSERNAQPVNIVNWSDAVAFCDWRGVRLPTEREWEYAAAGPDSWVYPWGDAFSDELVIWDGSEGFHTYSVGSRPGGASWVGALDMSGNVWEWVSSKDLPYPYAPDDGREDLTGEDMRVMRGGSFNTDTTFFGLRSASRYGDIPSYELINLGLRCARDSQSIALGNGVEPVATAETIPYSPVAITADNAQNLVELARVDVPAGNLSVLPSWVGNQTVGYYIPDTGAILTLALGRSEAVTHLQTLAQTMTVQSFACNVYGDAACAVGGVLDGRTVIQIAQRNQDVPAVTIPLAIGPVSSLQWGGGAYLIAQTGNPGEANAITTVYDPYSGEVLSTWPGWAAASSPEQGIVYALGLPSAPELQFINALTGDVLATYVMPSSDVPIALRPVPNDPSSRALVSAFDGEDFLIKYYFWSPFEATFTEVPELGSGTGLLTLDTSVSLTNLIPTWNLMTSTVDIYFVSDTELSRVAQIPEPDQSFVMVWSPWSEYLLVQTDTEIIVYGLPSE